MTWLRCSCRLQRAPIGARSAPLAWLGAANRLLQGGAGPGRGAVRGAEQGGQEQQELGQQELGQQELEQQELGLPGARAAGARAARS